jgi:hypothetical protein
MATNKKKYVQLGDEAKQGNFFDPFLGLKLLPGKIVELPSNFRKSKKTLSALRGGHLAYADSEDVENYLKNNPDNSDDNSDDDDGDDDDDVVTEAVINKMNKSQLFAFILTQDEDAKKDDYADKAELKEAALDFLVQED